MKKVKLFYFKGYNNFGDLLNINILENLFNVTPEWTEPKKADAVLIGSILENFSIPTINIKDKIKAIINRNIRFKPLTVLGSGFIKSFKGTKEFSYRKINPIAVRGKLTKQRIEFINNKMYRNAILGDPGLLANQLIKKNTKKKYQVGIIPHFFDKDSPAIVNLASNTKNSIIIDIQKDVNLTLTQIAECKTIISTAMHGLIVADSLGIPNQWAELNNLEFGDYKFIDYYSAFDLHPTPIKLNSISSITPQQIIDNYKVSYSQIKDKQEKLNKAIRDFI